MTWPWRIGGLSWMGWTRWNRLRAVCSLVIVAVSGIALLVWGLGG